MVLTDTHIRNAKPKAKSYKLSDGGGMYLLVKPDGARYWRLDYRFAGKRRTLALGVYPTTSLSKARTRRDEARSNPAWELIGKTFTRSSINVLAPHFRAPTGAPSRQLPRHL